MRSKSFMREISESLTGPCHGPRTVSAFKVAASLGAVLAGILCFTADAYAQGVQYDPTMTTFAGNGSLTINSGGNGGQATAAGLNNPEGIAYDVRGNTYIADYFNNQIRIVNSAGVINVFAGTGAACPNPTAATGACGDGGAASAATFNSPTAMQVDALGNLYIAESGNHRIRKIIATNGVITSASTITTVVGTGVGGTTSDGTLATAAELEAPHGVALDAAGDLWVANQGLGVSCTIGYVPATNQVITIGGTLTNVTAGRYYTVAGVVGSCGGGGSGTVATATQLNSPTNIALDTSGNLYIGDYSNGKIRKLATSSGTISTIAGTAYQACPLTGPTTGQAPAATPLCGDGGLATAAALYGPTGVYVDGSGNVIIGDGFGARVREISAATGVISTISGTSQQCTNINQSATFSDGAGNSLNFPNCGDGTPATNALVSFPILVSVNPQGNILYVDQYDNKIREISEHIVFPPTNVGNTGNPQTLNLQTIGTANTIVTSITSNNPQFTVGTTTGCALGGTTGNATNTVCATPITFTPAYPGVQTATITVVTNGGTTTYGVTGTGVAPQAVLSPGVLATVVGTGTAGLTGNNAAASAATLSGPRSNIVYDSVGNYYIADTNNNVVRRVTPAGVISTVAGTGVAGYSGDGNLATAATLNAPASVAVDSTGNLYIADYLNKVIREVSIVTGKISTYATGFSGPAALAINPITSDLYVADPPAQVVRVVNGSSGAVSIVAGQLNTACVPSTSTCGDGGQAVFAQLNSPNGLAFDGNSNLWIADYGDNRVRKFLTTSGVITTYAGTGTSGYSGDGGAATSATLSGPYSVNADAAGNLYIADSSNNVIRFVAAATDTITTLVGNGTACTTVPSPSCGDGGPANVSALASPQGISLDETGNLYITEQQTNRIRKVTVNPTAIQFPSAPAIGITEGPVTESLSNIGNASLIYTTPVSPNSNALVSTTSNPTTGTATPVNSNAFTQTNATTCGPIYSSTAASTLASGATCNYFVEFTPDTAVGNYTGTLVETDNSLNSGPGNSLYPVPLTQTINLTASAVQGAVTVLLSSNNNPSYLGQPVTLTATVTGGGIAPTGTVTFTYTPIGSTNPVTITGATVYNSSNGIETAALTTTTLPLGTDSVTATFNGDTNYLSGEKSSVLAQIVTQVSGSTTNKVTAAAATITYGTSDQLIYSIPVVAGVTVPAGTIVFTGGTGNTALGNATWPAAPGTGNCPSGSGTCYLLTDSAAPTNIPVGAPTTVTGTFTATSASGYASASPTTTVIVTQAPLSADTLAASPNPATSGATVTVSFFIPVPTGDVPPTGPVTFSSPGATFSTPTSFTATTVNGVTGYLATATTTNLPSGTDTITGTYTSSDPNYAGGVLTTPETINPTANTGDAVTASPSPTTLGASTTLTFTIPVASGAAVPAGTVTFTSGSTALGSAIWPATPTLIGGSYVLTTTTTSLPLTAAPATSTPVTATYAPTSASGYGAAAPTTTVVVNKIPGTGDNLTTNPNPSTFGQTVTLTEVIPTVAGFTPTGTVVFVYNGTAIGTGTVANGIATATTSTLPAGNDPITATYSGDGNYATVTSGPVTQVVNAASGNATLAVGPNPATFGTPVTLTETVTPINGVCPAGPVTFLNNGTSIGTGVITLTNGACISTLTTSILPQGTDSLTATIPASGSFAAVTSGPVALVVNKANGADTLTTNPNPSTFGSNVTITDTIPTVGGVAPTGTVNFYDFGTLIGTGTITNGVATLVTGTLPVGTDSITATYLGDGNYAQVTTTPVNQVVTTVSTSATLAAGPNPTTFGTQVTITETIPVVNGTPATGTVTFLSNGTVLGTGTLNGQGVASITTTTLPVGTDPLTATYLGNTNYAPVTSGPVNEVVTKANGPNTLTVNPDPAVFGATVTLTDTILTVGGVAPTGTVSFYNNGTLVGTAPVVNGVATLPTTTLPVGSDPITAVYTGDNNYATITTAPVNEIITTGNTTPVLGATPNPTTFGTTVTLTESIPGINGVTPTGRVTFSYTPPGSTTPIVIGTATVVNGVATVTTSTLPIGIDKATAVYAGDSNYSSATSGPLNVTITQAMPIDTLTANPNASNFGSPVTLTFTVPLVNGVVPTGTVTFYNGTTVLGLGTINSQGIATIITSTLPLGVQTITAKYLGDGTYAASSPTTLVTVGTASPGSSLTSSVPTGTTPACGTSITFTDTITQINGTAFSGTVQFYNNGVPIGSPVPVSAGGVATFTTTTLPCGATNSITAVFTPNPGSPYSPSTAGPVILPVLAPDFSISATPANQIVNPGDSAVYSVSLSGVTVPFTSPVTLVATCNCPGITISFANATVTPGQGPTSTTMNVLPSPTFAMTKPSRTPNQIFYGLLLLPLLGLGQVRRKLRSLPKGLSYCFAALILLGGLGAVTGCAGGYYGPQPKTCTITITGTSGALTHSTTVTVTVR